MPIVLTKPSASGFLGSAEIRANFQALANAVGQANLVADPTFLIWPGGDAVAPAHWTLYGAAGAVVRTGTGLTDTSRRVGKFAAKVTAPTGNAAGLRQSLLPTASYDDGFDGLNVSVGCWVKCSSANKAAIYLNDGVNGVPNGTGGSSFHSGSGLFEWLTATLKLDAAATKLELNLEVGSSANAVFSAPTVLLGDTYPQFFVPCPVAYGTLYFPVSGVLLTGRKADFRFARPTLVKDVQLFCRTAPTTQAIVVDVNQGSANSMFSTRPQIAAAAFNGGAQPDGTYQYRCFNGGFGSGPASDTLLVVDVDQVGSGTAGSDLAVHIRALQYLRLLEQFLGHNEIA